MKKNTTTAMNQVEEKKTTLAEKILTGTALTGVAGLLAAESFSGLAGNIVFFAGIALGAISVVLMVMLNLAAESKQTWFQKSLAAVIAVSLAVIIAAERVPAPASDIVFISSLVVGILSAVVLAKVSPKTDPCDKERA